MDKMDEIEEDALENMVKANPIINDRFTFDKVFRACLSEGSSHEDCKNWITCNCSFSALVYQERIYNRYWKKISLDEKYSKDLQELFSEEYGKMIKLRKPESLN
jgi:hypothetical protein